MLGILNLAFGAQIVSEKTSDIKELLYASPLSVADDKPVRGGVPVLFPLFANYGCFDKHGFARKFTHLPPGDWQKFSCVEPVCVSKAVVLAPGEIFEGVLLAQWGAN